MVNLFLKWLISTVWAEFDAYEIEIKSLKEGQKININTEAYPDENFEAEINFIDPVLNSSTRTVRFVQS